ncbi:MAG: sortase [Thermomicrobiales bacterium]
MTDEPDVALDAVTEKTTAIETEEETANQVADSIDERIADQRDDAAKPPADPPTVADGDDASPAPIRRGRGVGQLVGTLLIAAGILTILLTVGITAWNRHQQDAETRAFLSRVTTPSAAATSVSLAPATPFPSTVSGALVPDTARTPTANAGTRAAQPVATTSDGKDRTIIAAVPAPAATPLPTSSDRAAATNAPVPTPKPRMPSPTHLTIPAIKVDSSVIEVGVSPIEIDGQQALIWDVAPYAVGHHFSSANPGEGENVVLSGHDDWQGEVFKNLYKLKKGDEIDVQAGGRQIQYHVDEILLLPEVGQPLETRIENAKFIGTTGDERLTLITCWPYGVDDHRLVIIARPNQ